MTRGDDVAATSRAYNPAMPANSERKLLMLVDGHAMVFRAWFSIPERLSTSSGQDTRGAYGFLNTFLKVIRDRKPTHVAVAFDTPAPTFRDALFEEYKAQRPPVPEDLHAQVPMVKQILAALKVPVYEKDGYEADDVVGTISLICEEQGVEVLIVTGDADQLQLVSPTTKLLMYTGFADTRVYDVEGVKQKFGGLGPDKVPDIKAITGDPSDNIKGVPGLGEKTAVAVLAQMGSIEGVYERLDDVEKVAGLRGAKRARALLEQYREDALRGKKLTTIIRDAPLDFRLEDCRFWRYDRREVVETLLALEFRSIIAHVPEPALGAGWPVDGPAAISPLPSGEGQGAGTDGAPRQARDVQQPRQIPLSDATPSTPPASGATPLPVSDTGEQLAMTSEGAAPALPSTQAWRRDVDYRTVTTRGQLEELIREVNTPAGFAFDTETTSEDPMRAGLVGLSFAARPARSWYIPVGHTAPESPDAPLRSSAGAQRPLAPGQLLREEVLAALRPVFEDPAVPKTAHNANYDLTVLGEHGIEVRGLAFDSMIAAALVGRRAIGLKELALDMFHVEMTPITELIGTGRKQITMDRVPVEQASPYAAADADFAWRVQDRLRSEVDRENQGRVLFDIEMPLLPVIVRMERAGVLIDRSVLADMSEYLATEIAAKEKEAAESLGGRELNLNANQQLAAVLFDELGVPRTKRTKTGYTMDANALEGILELEDLDNRAYHLVKAILRYRELAKIKSTYVDALPGLINPRTGRVHTSFNQVGSATGRLSSTDPNVQNIPVRTELGRRVRKAFVADHERGWLLLGADYSQIELRILAHLSQEPHLLEAFRRGEDIHSATARAMYGVPEVEKVTPEQRRIAKILNFGVIYGLGAHGVAMQTDLTRQQGQQFIDMYFGKYPGVRDYIAKTKQEAHARGYAETIMGRRRRLPDLKSASQGHRAAAERVAINMPIQGTAADVIKIAMVNIDGEIRKRKMRSRMIIQVHDELIFEVAPGELDEVREMAVTMMPAAMQLSVPLTVETKLGKTWGDME
jgi:DNA polymerase-1